MEYIRTLKIKIESNNEWAVSDNGIDVITGSSPEEEIALLQVLVAIREHINKLIDEIKLKDQ